MTPLLQWAARWGIPHAALSDLMATLGAGHAAVPPPPGSTGSEASVQATVRLEAARRGMRLWRNNTGAAQDETGRVIRYGLANDSPAVSKVCKSSDLIGITPVTCPCGHKYGVFTAVECKAPGWKFRESDQRATAQLAFIKLVVSMGGIGRFITRVEDL